MAVDGDGMLPFINKPFQLEYKRIFELFLVKHKMPKTLDEGIYLPSDGHFWMFHFFGFFEQKLRF